MNLTDLYRSIHNCFGDDRLIGYGLMGVGVLLAVADIFNCFKRTN